MANPILAPMFDPGDAFSHYAGQIALQAGQASPYASQYQQSAPAPRDYMARENRFWGNNNFSPPGGFSSANPISSLVMGMAQRAIFGDDYQNMRPSTTPQMSSMDFLRGRYRFQQAQSALGAGGAGSIMGSSADYLTPRIGATAANNPYARQIYDMFDPRGSQAAAFQGAYSNFGYKLSPDMSLQSGKVMSMMEQMNKQFSTNGKIGGKRSAIKSSNMDDSQTVEAMDAGLRYGIGGLSDERLSKAVDSGKSGELFAQNNKIFSKAADTFGKDKTVEQLAQLMSKISDEFKGLDPNKATALLGKINATARAVGISAEAFVNYGDTMKQMYEAVGVPGSQITQYATRASYSAKAATQIGMDAEDSSISDITANHDGKARASARLHSTNGMKRVVAVGSIIAQMSEEEKAGTDIEGYGSIAKQMEVGADGKTAIQRRLDSGDAKEVTRFNDAFDRATNNRARNRSNYLTKDDYKRSNKVQDTSTFEGTVDGKAEVDRLSKSITSSNNIESGLMDKIGGQKGVNKILEEIDSNSQGGDINKVREIINNKFGNSLDTAEKDRLAGQFAQSFGDAAGHGPGTEQERDLALATRRDRGGRIAKMQAQAQKDEDMEKYIQGIVGDSLTPINLKDVIDLGLEISKEADANNGQYNNQTVKNKDGSWNFGGLKAAGGKALSFLGKIEENKDLNEATNPKSFKRISDLAEDVYQKELKSNGGDKEKADAARAKAIDDQIEEYRKSKEDDPNKAPSAPGAGPTASGNIKTSAVATTGSGLSSAQGAQGSQPGSVDLATAMTAIALAVGKIADIAVKYDKPVASTKQAQAQSKTSIS